jgi:hypothetical protein
MRTQDNENTFPKKWKTRNGYNKLLFQEFNGKVRCSYHYLFDGNTGESGYCELEVPKTIFEGAIKNLKHKGSAVMTEGENSLELKWEELSLHFKFKTEQLYQMLYEKAIPF